MVLSYEGGGNGTNMRTSEPDLANAIDSIFQAIAHNGTKKKCG
jgi:hypothetical protein